tara:strand:+ start:25206 stop:25823 length:618 start_codon:yes stop_codon:yes gene_type:complete
MNREQISLVGITKQKFDEVRAAKGFLPLLTDSGARYCVITGTIGFQDMQDFYHSIEEELDLFSSIAFSMGFSGIEEVVHPGEERRLYENIKEGMNLFASIASSTESSGIGEAVNLREKSEIIRDLFLSKYAHGYAAVKIEYCDPKHPSKNRDWLVFRKRDDVIRCEEAFIGPHHLGEYTISSNLEGMESPFFAIYTDNPQDFLKL